MILVCYLFGSGLVSERVGALWALIYLTAGLPGMLARAGVIDHTFNLWITVATLCLFCYDKFEGHGKRETHGLKPAKTFLPVFGLTTMVDEIESGELGLADFASQLIPNFSKASAVNTPCF